MKYELETIPIWEAYKENTECPICILEKKNEGQYIKFFLGDSLMDPATRVEVNRYGFCPYHSELLLEGGHKLGLALMTHTYLLEYSNGFKQAKDKLTESQLKEEDLAKLLDYLTKPLRECVFCQNLAYSLKRYAFTITYLFRKDPDFKIALQNSKGFCISHLKYVLEMAWQELKGKEQMQFFQIVLELQEKRFADLLTELDWFIQKFDFRHKDKSWGMSKDSLVRTLQKLKGHRFYNRQP